ncbi:hypothetical protein SERLA73DRAFT_15612, partial [Serpula lacrymans var. lacrymans S7.3]
KIKYPLNMYADLAFIVPDGSKVGDSPPPKFLVFFDDIQEAIGAAKFLQSRLPVGLRDKIKWFNSDMSATFKEKEYEHMCSGDTWGLCMTDSFGMGMDIPDIMSVVQW